MLDEKGPKKIRHTIKNVKISGFRSIQEASLPFEKINVLVGANGSGKSNLLEALKLLNLIAHQKLEQYSISQSSLDSLFFANFPTTDEIAIDLEFASTAGINRYKVCIVGSLVQGLKLLVKEETVSFLSSQHPTAKTLTYNTLRKETNLVGLGKTGIPWIVADFLKKIFFYQPDTSVYSKIKEYSKIDDNAELKSDASNLVPFLYFLQEREADSYKRIKKNLQRIAPFFEDFILRPSPLKEGHIKFEWKPKGMEGYWDAHSMSNGTLRVLAFLTLLLQPNPPDVILLDEPEIGLHPFAVHLIVNLIMSHSSQFLMATQSADFLDYFSPSHVITADRNFEASVFQRVDSNKLQAWLKDYKMGDLWEKNVFGGNVR